MTLSPIEIYAQRRKRAVNRAITRAVASPTDSAFALVEWLKTVDASAFDTDLLDVHASRAAGGGWAEYWVDGTRVVSRDAAVALIQDRCGLLRSEADALVPGGSRTP